MRRASYVSCMRCNADLTKKGVTRKRCAGCHSVFYDNATCQKEDWAIHRAECKERQSLFVSTVQAYHPEVDSMAKLLARPDVCEKIATSYHRGENGFEQNDGLAVFWATQWMKGGDVGALTTLGTIYLTGSGVPADKTKGRKLVRTAADQGHPEAQSTMGDMFRLGDGVRVNNKESARWYRLAAEGGYAEAQRLLGRALEYGDGVKMNQVEAVVWTRKAAEQGDVKAQYNLGVALMTRAQTMTDATAAAVHQVEAVKWVRRAAEQGNELSGFFLGQCLERGAGVAKDPTEAVFWYRKSADRGNVEAQSKLGVCYFLGTGVGLDREEGMRLLRLSADQGYGPSKDILRGLENAK
eukprot:TRINITY_DN3822_c0_g3_i1.p1 TRINITY_DN3822_c0_g3~~TRINITY_DN3822_c0_g3_i1.p1  ORF type:complete len:353 (-),score=44.75 TRINITY_DN3822_c0_g3_i1:183-1241(-)